MEFYTDFSQSGDFCVSAVADAIEMVIARNGDSNSGVGAPLICWFRIEGLLPVRISLNLSEMILNAGLSPFLYRRPPRVSRIGVLGLEMRIHLMPVMPAFCRDLSR